MTTRAGRKPVKKKIHRPSKSWKEYLLRSLHDPEEAAAYLNAALEDEDLRVFLLALRDVAEARGVSTVAVKSRLNRENTYRILSSKGNPQLSSLAAILSALDLRLSIEPRSESR